ncbi:MAG: aldo/keto reductase [Myxococcaceae bacterium]|jgi:aryl-alcohol dehydrogenase-like predicted oxidoreductase|nr:aldo/keto reductase [Myxococcaceae bacterium]MCA3012351.1 aldo/keto reductase [Myxococcaceae bacterium]
MSVTSVEQRPFGCTGLTVSALGFGGSELGFDEGVTPAAVAGLLHPAIDAGLTVIDTASAYLESERLIGEALVGRRERVQLFTKCGATDGFSRSDWSAIGIRHQIEASLRRLKTDRVELLQLHSCSVEVLARGAAIEALETLAREGKTRFIGYSGDGEAAVWAAQCGRFDALQTSVNVADQRVLDEALPLARARGMAVIAKRPVANVAWRHGAGGPPDGYHREYWRRLRALDFDFTRRPLGEAVGVALRFTAFQPGVSTAIVGSSSPGRWNENAALLALGPLPEGEVQALRRRWQERADSSWTGQV